MIVFTPFERIPQEFFEYKDIGQVVVFNLTSNLMNGIMLKWLIPSPEYMPEHILAGDSSMPEFDNAYWNYIFSNNNAFMELMQIIIPVYHAANSFVSILINNTNPYAMDITESLSKLIQQRYGYTAAIVNDLDDIWYLEESTFSIPGLMNLDQDLIRWHSMMPNENIYE